MLDRRTLLGAFLGLPLVKLVTPKPVPEPESRSFRPNFKEPYIFHSGLIGHFIHVKNARHEEDLGQSVELNVERQCLVTGQYNLYSQYGLFAVKADRKLFHQLANHAWHGTLNLHSVPIVTNKGHKYFEPMIYSPPRRVTLKIRNGHFWSICPGYFRKDLGPRINVHVYRCIPVHWGYVLYTQYGRLEVPTSWTELHQHITWVNSGGGPLGMDLHVISCAKRARYNNNLHDYNLKYKVIPVGPLDNEFDFKAWALDLGPKVVR